MLYDLYPVLYCIAFSFFCLLSVVFPRKYHLDQSMGCDAMFDSFHDTEGSPLQYIRVKTAHQSCGEILMDLLSAVVYQRPAIRR